MSGACLSQVGDLLCQFIELPAESCYFLGNLGLVLSCFGTPQPFTGMLLAVTCLFQDGWAHLAPPNLHRGHPSQSNLKVLPKY